MVDRQFLTGGWEGNVNQQDVAFHGISLMDAPVPCGASEAGRTLVFGAEQTKEKRAGSIIDLHNPVFRAALEVRVEIQPLNSHSPFNEPLS